MDCAASVLMNDGSVLSACSHKMYGLEWVPTKADRNPPIANSPRPDKNCAMPVSLPIFDEEIELLFKHLPFDSVLDIGPGEGKYGKMLQRLQPSARRIGVELDASYVEQYRLREIYDDVLVQDAARLMDRIDQTHGAIIIGDVIEHMRKSVGLDLLNFLVYRSRVIIVKFPVQMLQNAWDGHASEAHVSVWSEHDFAGFDHIFVQRDLMRLVLIRGYLNRTIEWLPPEVMRRLGWENVTAFYDQSPKRWSLADLDTLRRQQAIGEIRQAIPEGEKFILIDEDQSGLGSDFPGLALLYLEKEGEYNGMPNDDAHAIAELERMKAGGAKHVVVAWTSPWVLKYYQGLAQRLALGKKLLENDRLTIFAI
jgi:hypothetical protein